MTLILKGNHFEVDWAREYMLLLLLLLLLLSLE